MWVILHICSHTGGAHNHGSGTGIQHLHGSHPVLWVGRLPVQQPCRDLYSPPRHARWDDMVDPVHRVLDTADYNPDHHGYGDICICQTFRQTPEL